MVMKNRTKGLLQENQGIIVLELEGNIFSFKKMIKIDALEDQADALSWFYSL